MEVSYVCWTTSLFREVFMPWIGAISSHCGPFNVAEDDGCTVLTWQRPLQPDDSPPELRYRAGLFLNLEAEQWKRVCWFYVSDRLNGVSIRLYDFDHRHNCGEFYLPERTAEGGEDRVIVRGEHLGEATGALKAAMRKGQALWPATAAPEYDGADGHGYDLFSRCGSRFEVYTAKRHAYFESPRRNNLPGFQAWTCPLGQQCVCPAPTGEVSVSPDRSEGVDVDPAMRRLLDFPRSAWVQKQIEMREAEEGATRTNVRSLLLALSSAYCDSDILGQLAIEYRLFAGIPISTSALNYSLRQLLGEEK